MGQQMLALMAASLLVLGGEAGDFAVMPIPTPQGLAADAGFSPRPTDPPGSVPGVPRELLQRQQDDNGPVPYPAPGWYCGLVSGQADWPLSCIDARAHCVFAGTAVGCCLGRSTRECRTQIPTSCVNSRDGCPECLTDSRILHCNYDTSSPYCGSYVFGDGTSLVGCYAFETITETVMEMSDYFSSVYGPNYTTMDGDDDDDDDRIFTEPNDDDDDDDDDEITTESSSTPTEPTDTVFTMTLDPEPTAGSDEDSEDSEDGDSGSGRSGSGGSKVSGGGIAGIVVGSVAGVAAIGGLIAWWLRRKRNNAAQAAQQGQPPNQPPPAPTYGHPPPPAAPYYEPKPPMAHEAPAYTAYDPKHQSVVSAAPTTSTTHPAPPVSEMPGSPTYGHQRMSSGPTSPPMEGMSATHTGPTPELYEIGPSR